LESRTASPSAYLVAIMSPGARWTGVGAVLSAVAGRTHAESGDRVAVLTSTAVAGQSTLVAVITTWTRTIARHTSPPRSADTCATHVVAPGAVLTPAVMTTFHTERSLRTLYTTRLLT